LVKSFTVNVNDGVLNIGFTSSKDLAKIAGIEVLPSIAATVTNDKNTSLSRNVAAALKIKAAPNPSSNAFNLSFTGGDGTALAIRIVHSTGSMVEQFRNVDPAHTIKIGHDYMPGTYHIEVIQSGRRTVGTLIRL
jgi:hypothetical protein